MTREDYIKNLQSMINDAEDMGLYDEDVESLQVAIKALEQEPKTGHWIVDRKTFRMNLRGKQEFSYRVHCDNCNYHWDFTTDKEYSLPSNYCPNCGAKMESEE